MTSRDITYFLELRRQKIVQASCSCQFLACVAIMFYFPPNGLDYGQRYLCTAMSVKPKVYRECVFL